MTEQSSDNGPSLARQVAAQDSVRALKWIGVLALVYSALNTVTPPPTPIVMLVGDVTLGVLFILAGLLLTWRRAEPGLVAWVFAGAITIEIVWGLWAYVSNPLPIHLLYLAILITAFGPLTAVWRPFLTAVAVMFVSVTWVLIHVGGKGVASWIIGMSAAMAVSAVLLRIRIRSMRQLESTEQALLEASTHDHLTGLLNRHGLRDHLPGIWAEARRRGEPVSLYFLDVHGLKHVNDAHGHDLGDTVLQDAAKAITETVRGSDLVARWGGDEFVIVGLGQTLASDAFAARLDEKFVEVSQARRDSKVGEISLGLAVGSPAESEFDVLLRQADADMYARRVLDHTTR